MTGDDNQEIYEEDHTEGFMSIREPHVDTRQCNQPWSQISFTHLQRQSLPNGRLRPAILLLGLLLGLNDIIYRNSLEQRA